MVTPYPDMPQVGLTGGVYAAGVAVVDAVVVKVAKSSPVEVPTQYPVP